MGEYITETQEAIGGLGNEDTDNKLQFIEDLHALGASKYVDLPQLVVVGDQSSGKSSVLQAITQLPFPVDDKMCTKFPTEVSLHRSSELKSMTFSIKPGTDDDSPQDERHEQEMLEWHPEVLTDIDSMSKSDFARKLSQILEEGSKVILGSSGDNDRLTGSTLHISVKGPKEIGLTIVDIPGLVCAGHPQYEKARSLVERYITNSKSIILAVAHPADPGTQEVFQILKNIDKKESRVIGVITKCDRKQEGAENWILDTIRNQHTGSNQHYLDQGWFGLRNRLPSEKDTSNQERDKVESAFFRQSVWKDLNHPKKFGIDHLRKALTKMLNTHITDSIPKLIPEIKQQLAECKIKLNQLGEARSTKSAQLQCMVKLASDFSKLSTYALDGHYDKLPNNPRLKIRKLAFDYLETFVQNLRLKFYFMFDLGNNIKLTDTNSEGWAKKVLETPEYKEIWDMMHANRGKESPGEVNPCVMGLLWKLKTEEWAAAPTAMIDQLVSAINLAMGLLFEECCPDEELWKNTQQWLMECQESVAHTAQKELDRLLSDERNGLVWTLNPQRSERLKERADRRINMLVEQLDDHWEVAAVNPDKRRMQLEKTENKIKLWLGKEKNISAVFDTYDRLASYYEVAMNRFVDNVGHQVVERHLLGPNSPLRVFEPDYVFRTLGEDNDALQRLAGENESKVAERAALSAEKASLESALSKAWKYGYC